ncbi:MAG: AI-2E family transporter [Burkholderiales bacterium]|nr:AI-2E family transporter [Burkholderiales bacterium]
MQLTTAQKSFVAWSLVVVVAAALLWRLSPVLTPFVVASVLAYALTPVVDWLDELGRGRIPRLLAVMVVELFFILAVLGLLLLMVQILAKEIPLMREQLPLVMGSFHSVVAPWLKQWGIPMSLDGGSIQKFAMKYLNANVEDAFGSLMTSLKIGGSVAFAVVGNAILIPVALFYLLMDWGRFVAYLRELIPVRMRAAADGFMEEADAVLGQYLRGQLLVMVILAGFYSVGLALFGLELALPIGIFTGLAAFVPYVGFGIGLVLATLAGILEFSGTVGMGHALLMVTVVFGSGQLVEGFFLTPRLVGERIGLHPLAVIFALLAFGQIFGFVGVLIALPVSAVLLVAMRRIKARYMNSPLYKG